MRRWRYPLSLIGLSGFLLLLIFSRIPSLQAAVLTLGVADSNTLFGELGTPLNVQFTVNGATPAPDAYNFVLSSGTLPPGTLLFGNTGQLTNIPATEGQYPISVTVSNGLGDASIATPFTICVGIAIGPATLPAITATLAYGPVNITTTCGNGDVDFTLSGAPAGIVIDAETGVISGTTSQEGPFTLRVTATDAAGRSSFKDYTVNSTYPNLIATPGTLPNGFVSTLYNSTITFSGRPVPLTVTLLTGVGETSLPTGLTVTPSNGQFILSGTPTANSSGTYKVVVRVTDANGRSTDMPFPFSISLPKLTISPGGGLPYTFPDATVGLAYNQPFTVGGGTAPYIVTNVIVNRTNSGLSLAPASQSADGKFAIDGTPLTAGPYTITLTIKDSSVPQRDITQVYSLTIKGGNNPAYSSLPPVGGIIGFGIVSTPGTDVVQGLVVANTGPALLKICDADRPCNPLFSGPNAGDFRIGGNITLPLELTPGAIATLVIVCRPSNILFPSTATMTFRTNDPVRPVVTYQLLCNQVAPTSTPGVGTPTAVSGTAAPSVQVIGRATAIVTEAPDTFATVTFVKGLALRSGPYLGSTMLGIIRPKKDYPVLALNSGDGEGKFNWYLIVDVDNNRIGWASGRYLILKGDPNIPYTPTIFDQIDNARDVKARLTVFGNVNIRARPSDRMPVIHTTAYGTELEIIGRTVQAGVTQWIQVRFYDTATGRPIVGWLYYNFNAPELMKLTGIAPLDAVPLR